MADLFTNQGADYGGSFAANKASMTFSAGANGNGGLGLLVQNVQSQYQQDVSRLWSIDNSRSTFFVVGRAAGTLGIGRIVGPEVIADAFVNRFSDVCQVEGNVVRLSATPGVCARGVNADRTFKYVLLNSISLQMASQNMLIQEQIGAMFASLENSQAGNNANNANNGAFAA